MSALQAVSRSFLLVVAVAISACYSINGPESKGSRDARWANPLKVEGLPNFHQITPALYRGAQPEASGMRELKKRGIKTIVNFRHRHSDMDVLRSVGLEQYFNYIEIPTNTRSIDDDTVIQFLSVVKNRQNRPIFFHCQYGADRTGTMAAAYRIVVQGWRKEEAIREMKGGGFGFHALWRHLPKYLESLDIKKIRSALGSDGISSMEPPNETTL